MESHAIQFNNHRICNARIENRELVITDYDTNRLFVIHLYINLTIKRKDFLSKYKTKGNQIRYPLRASDVLLFLKEGFKFTYKE